MKCHTCNLFSDCSSCSNHTEDCELPGLLVIGCCGSHGELTGLILDDTNAENCPYFKEAGR